MFKAIHSGSTLVLNTSNDPSIPQEGLVLEAGVPIPVSRDQAAYLRTLPNVAVVEDSTAAPIQPTASAFKE